MVKQLAAIKLRSIWNALTDKVYILIFSLLAYLYGLFLIASISLGLIWGMADGQRLALYAAVAVGALFTLGWVVLPIVFASQEGTLDPAKLTPYVSNSRKLALSLVLVTGVGMAGIYLLIIALVEIIAWSIYAGPVGTVLAVVGSALGIATCWVWTRGVGAWAGRRKDSSRAGRDRTTIILTIGMMLVVAPAGIWVPALLKTVRAGEWELLLSYVQWTPFGAAWALPMAGSEQDWVALIILFAISIATVALGWWFYSRQLGPAMTGQKTKITTEIAAALAEGRPIVDPSKKNKQNTDVTNADGIPNYFPGANRWLKLGMNPPSAAIAERTWKYWLKDPRLSTQLGSTLVLLVMAIILPKFIGSNADSVTEISMMPIFGVGMVVFSAFLIGQIIGTLLQFDSTALWIEVSAGTKGQDDRLGRFMGSLVISLGLMGIAAVAFGLFSGLTWLNILYLFSLMLLLFAGSYASTTIIGSKWIYPVQPPGVSAMSSRGTGQFMTTMFVSSAQFFGGFILAAIPLGIMAWGFFSNATWMPFTVIFTVLWSVGLVVLTIFVGGKMFSANQVELLTKISNWPGHRASA